MFDSVDDMVTRAIRESRGAISAQRVREALLSMNLMDAARDDAITDALLAATRQTCIPKQLRNNTPEGWVWRAITVDQHDSRDWLRNAWSWVEGVTVGTHDLGRRDWLIGTNGERMHALGMEADDTLPDGFGGWRDKGGAAVDLTFPKARPSGIGRMIPPVFDGQDIDLRHDGRYTVSTRRHTGGPVVRTVLYVIDDQAGTPHAYNAQYIWDVAGKAGQLRWFAPKKPSMAGVFAPFRGTDMVSGGLAVVMPCHLPDAD